VEPVSEPARHPSVLTFDILRQSGRCITGGWAEKLKLGRQSTLRSTATEDGLRRTGKRKSHGGGRGAQRQFLALLIFLFLAPFFLKASGFRFPLSALRFLVSAVQRFSFWLQTRVLESRLITARSCLLGFLIAYSTRSEPSRVRWVCCWRDVILITRRTNWGQAVGWRFLTCDPANLWLTPAMGWSLQGLIEQLPKQVQFG
jgi:hypothetical protein